MRACVRKRVPSQPYLLPLVVPQEGRILEVHRPEARLQLRRPIGVGTTVGLGLLYIVGWLVGWLIGWEVVSPAPPPYWGTVGWGLLWIVVSLVGWLVGWYGVFVGCVLLFGWVGGWFEGGPVHIQCGARIS